MKLLMNRLRKEREEPEREPPMRMVARSPVTHFAMGAAAAGMIGLALDRRRRKMVADKAASAARSGAEEVTGRAREAAEVATGKARGAAEAIKPEREYDDVTLARKVESEIFRDAGSPKGSVDVNVQDGIVELRGEVKRPEDLKALASQAAAVEGVKQVHNLLHTPGSPPKHAPPDLERAKQKAKTA